MTCCFGRSSSVRTFKTVRRLVSHMRRRTSTAMYPLVSTCMSIIKEVLVELRWSFLFQFITENLVVIFCFRIVDAFTYIYIFLTSSFFSWSKDRLPILLLNALENLPQDLAWNLSIVTLGQPSHWNPYQQETQGIDSCDILWKALTFPPITIIELSSILLVLHLYSESIRMASGSLSMDFCIAVVCK